VALFILTVQIAMRQLAFTTSTSAMVKANKLQKTRAAQQTKATESARRCKRRGSENSEQEVPVAKKKRTSKAKGNAKKGKGKGKAYTDSESDQESSIEEIEEICPADNEEIQVESDDSEAGGSDSESQVNDHFRAHGNKLLTLFWQGEGLPDVSAPVLSIVKGDSTRDLLLIFSEKVKVKFNKDKIGTSEILRGRWCKLCR
jgi:hypothetical protein